LSLGRLYPKQNCAAARALEIVGERWTLLIVRDVLLGIHRFDELRADLGIASNTLSARLQALSQTGVLHQSKYTSRPARYEYLPTDAADHLREVIAALARWGEEHGRPAHTASAARPLGAPMPGAWPTTITSTDAMVHGPASRPNGPELDHPQDAYDRLLPRGEIQGADTEASMRTP